MKKIMVNNIMDAKIIFSLGFTLSENITSIQRKIWNILLSNSKENLKDGESFGIPYLNIIEQTGLDADIIREAIVKLSQCIIQWNIYDSRKKQGMEFCPLFSYCKFMENDIIYNYPPLLKDKINSPDRFSEKIDLSMQNHFSSKHARNLFGICLDYFNFDNDQADITISISDLKLLLNIEESQYPEFKIFNRDILKKSIDEINEKSNLKISIEFTRKNNVTNSAHLCITKKKIIIDDTTSITFSQPNHKISIKNESLIKFLDKNGISTQTIQRYSKKLFEHNLSLRRFEDYLLYIKNLYDKSNSKNSSYFMESLVKQHNIETFLQKVDAEKRKEEENVRLEQLYMESQIDYAREYLKEKPDLFHQLVNTKTENIAVKVLTHSLYPHELIKSKPIILYTIPIISSNLDYKFMGFEQWKKANK